MSLMLSPADVARFIDSEAVLATKANNVVRARS